MPRSKAPCDFGKLTNTSISQLPWSRAMILHLHINYGHFCATLAFLYFHVRVDRDHMHLKSKVLTILAFYGNATT